MLEALSNVANKMPASLGSNISKKDQQQSNSLYSSNSSLKTTSIVNDSLLSTSIATTAQLQQIEQTNKMKLIKDSELIDNKFNELAKKILEELKQTQYSKEFFKAIDDIIKEPTSKIFISSHNNYLSKRANYHNKYQKLLSRQQQQILQQQQQLQQLLTKEKSQTRASQTDQQPRSLPVDVSIGIQQQQRQSQQQQQQQQQLVTRRKTNSDTTTPSNNDGPVSKAAATAITSPNRGGSVYQKVQNSYPLSRSATAVESMPNTKRQQQLPRKSSNVISSSNQDNCENNNQYLYRRHKNYSAGNVLNNHIKRSTDNHNSHYHDDGDDDDDDDDDEDDEDDDDNEDDENGDGHSISPANQHVDNYQRFSPISKSKTLSDTTNISEINMLTKQHSPRQQQQQQQQQQQKRQLNYHQQQYLQPNQKQQQQPQRFIKTTVVNNNTQLQSQSSSNQDHHSEPKSMVLNSRDIGSFYKPHMNYSTSVLGNHRLSDDDEIIIIPTQSPSLVSNSPDPDHANADELTERFSISRTKSFWEKLSKGNHGKRASQQQQSLQQPQHHQYNIGNNKQAIGVKLNGHSNTLDRMDSTGGSNSNYSCSSSGDENGVGSHSQQNPAISEQEMSRQNRLRQTR